MDRRDLRGDIGGDNGHQTRNRRGRRRSGQPRHRPCLYRQSARHRPAVSRRYRARCRSDRHLYQRLPGDDPVRGGFWRGTGAKPGGRPDPWHRDWRRRRGGWPADPGSRHGWRRVWPYLCARASGGRAWPAGCALRLWPDRMHRNPDCRPGPDPDCPDHHRPAIDPARADRGKVG